jgi:hypothetical protein
VPIETGGSGAATTTPVGSVVADVDPPLAVAVTTSERVEPMSSGVRVRCERVARGIATHETPLALQRRQRYVNFVGEPVHVPTVLLRIRPSCAVPRICGGLTLAGGEVVGVPVGETAAVGAETAVAEPAAEAAVTTTSSARPTSVLTGRYDSRVAPEIETQFAPAASQRDHWYENLSGFPPSQVPGTAAMRRPATAGPTSVGGAERSGGPVGYGSIATAAGFVPFIRSASVHPFIPRTDAQSVHCQNVQPFPFQFLAGTDGWPLDVQCAIQRPLPAAAAAVESPRCDFQKRGEV